MKAQQKQFPILCWGGYVDDTLHCLDGVVAVFSTRAEAKRQYEDVRRVEIREVEAPR